MNVFDSCLTKWYDFSGFTDTRRPTLKITKNKTIASLLVAGLIFASVPSVGLAEPSVSSKQAEAEAVKKQIDSLDNNLDAAVENYNAANAAHADIVKKQDAAAARIKEADAKITKLQSHLSDRVNAMYRGSSFSFVEVLFDAHSFEEFASTWDTLQQLNASDTQIVEEMNKVKKEQVAAKADFDAQEKAAADKLAQMNTQKKAIDTQLTERKTKLAGLNKDIAAQLAAIRAADNAKVSKPSNNSGGGKTFPAPTNAPKSEVVSIAKKYLGAPYVWAASGPNSFDCSGFTMFVYDQVGVNLPHSSRSQINSGQRVSYGDLQPGDLVFFGSPIHHVGIYIGNGQYIHAPTEGDVVKISSLGSNSAGFSGACRP